MIVMNVFFLGFFILEIFWNLFGKYIYCNFVFFDIDCGKLMICIIFNNNILR